ncbi:MAG: DUF4194 domain-containing protein [Rhodocyclaceae bacterium]
MSLTNTAIEHLNLTGLKLNRFKEVVARLFAYGIVVRAEGGVEALFYDDARRMENLLFEYFGLAGFLLHHDTKAEFFRLYAPGAQAPGITPEDEEPVPSLRAKLSPEFVAAALAIRFLYQKGLMDGGTHLTDEGEVLIRLEDLAETLQAQLKRPLPDSASEREKLLRELRRHRLIRLSPTFSMTDEDALIAIRQTILGIISEDALSAVIEGGVAEPLAEEEDVDEA